MGTRTITLKDHSELKDVLTTMGYKKHKAFVIDTDSVQLSGTFWDGGSISRYTAVRLDGFPGGYKKAMPVQNPPQFGGPREAPTHPVNPGYLIVKMGTFVGNPTMATIYIHPTDQTRFGL